jgi:hypothetical protein
MNHGGTEIDIARGGTLGYYFTGSIDDIRVYSYSLSSTQVTNLANGYNDDGNSYYMKGNAGLRGTQSGNNPGTNGIAVIKYLLPQVGSGGTVTNDGTYVYHTFTTNGVYTA